MDPLRPSSAGYASSASGRPHTPPYTPQLNRNRGKRRLERSDSPASPIHPAETSSPAKKAARRAAAESADTVKVQELLEGDVGYFTDADVVYPQELEEVGSNDNDGDGELSSSEEDEDAELSDPEGLIRRVSRMRCEDKKEEAAFEEVRRHRRLSKRMGSRNFKRTHSESLKGDSKVAFGDQTVFEDGTDVTDPDARDDHDLPAAQRRLRRRTKGPRQEEVMVFEDVARSSPEYASVGTGSVTSAAYLTPEREMPDVKHATSRDEGEDEDMDVDETK